MLASAVGIPLEQAERAILQALNREGGELTPSELVLTTSMPYDVVKRALGKLEQEEKVKVNSTRTSGLETIVLP